MQFKLLLVAFFTFANVVPEVFAATIPKHHGGKTIVKAHSGPSHHTSPQTAHHGVHQTVHHATRRHTGASLKPHKCSGRSKHSSLHKRNDLDTSVWQNIRNPKRVMTPANYPLFLGVQNEILGNGMCGEVKTVFGHPHLVAKVYHDGSQHSHDTALHEGKMLEKVELLKGFNDFQNRPGHDVQPILYMKKVEGVPLTQTNYYKNMPDHQARVVAMNYAKHRVAEQVWHHLQDVKVLHNDIKMENVLWTEHTDQHGTHQIHPNLIDWQGAIDMSADHNIGSSQMYKNVLQKVHEQFH
ncbi:hypothetical protein CPB84DRAFT_1794691 [Gymnopilus junonius]|uniref:Protein kinase domain-containing protein n=1 Tax=Gymnopilus junonius TaxID=109634 RepID=A0A9P5THC2_GYMJU|nr:hypothetical protein CPB84DRAFT_1794691 [Gymnopilus junonius]